ncbi:GLPGLI family protein [Tenacibaculum jejuense]|uniref:GLPGLI family protein n=1 Tax=Tenacibaculum jejuense TaxID=584609 RepID=A0A238U7B6_9FLAO|nr:GLPGLI family protein [Tenacibaculum jejuense]SNR14374.1 conserved exported protein of unknown function [Tenacibaculum jejuense]
MNKICSFLFSLFSILNLFAQSYEIEYNQIVDFDAHTTEAVYKLIYKEKQSVYYQLNSEFTENNGNDVIEANEGVVPFVQKNYKNKEIVYNQPIMSSIKFVSDKLPIQTWKLENKTKKIKSFTCKKAVTTFRGRTYTAWYTEDIPLIGGPWKFDGLPGLILSVSSDDGVLSIEATKIQRKNIANIIHFNYKQDKLISWKMYCEKYRKVIERIRKNLKADTDPDMEYDLNINLIEDIGL